MIVCAHRFINFSMDWIDEPHFSYSSSSFCIISFPTLCMDEDTRIASGSTDLFAVHHRKSQCAAVGAAVLQLLDARYASRTSLDALLPRRVDKRLLSSMG